MTIAIAISIAEGIVLAADSRTTHWIGEGDSKRLDISTDHARKVFPLSPRTGSVTHGRSHINRQTIASLADRFRWARGRDASEDVSAVVGAFAEFVHRVEAERDQASQESRNETTGFIIGGYGDDGVGKLYELRIPGAESRILSTTESPNYHWRGQGDAVTRLMKGVDPGFDRSELDPKIAEGLTALEYAVKLRDMSLKDAIDFIRLLGQVAIGIDRFTSGTVRDPRRQPFVGGSLAIAVVTGEGFRCVHPPDAL